MKKEKSSLNLSLRKKKQIFSLRQEALVESANDLSQLSISLLANLALLLNNLENTRTAGLQVSQEVSLPLQDLVNGDLVKETVNTGENERNHLVDSHGGVLLLLQQLSQSLTTRKSLLGGSVQVGTELGEGSDLTVLRQEQLEGTGDLLHGLELGGGTDTGDGKTDVDGGADTLVEELGLQEDLAVGDGNDVGGDVSGDITTLGLNDGEGSEGAAAVLVVQLSGTLEKTRVEVEDTVREKKKSSRLVYRSQWRGKSEKQLGFKTYSPG